MKNTSALFSIGLDFGTLSVRAVLVSASTGEVVGRSEAVYPGGCMEVEKGYALSDPKDYLECMVKAVHELMNESGTEPEQVIAIGVDATSSTVLPVDEALRPLSERTEFQDHPQALVKLWKHHGGEAECPRILEAAEAVPGLLSSYGGHVSAEWMLPKVLETLHKDREVFDKTAWFMEAADWITSRLLGRPVLSVCTMGFKAFYKNGQFPPVSFFETLDPALADFPKRYGSLPITKPGEKAGPLCHEMAEKLGLCEGIAVGTAMIDAHASFVGGGLQKPGELMLIMGTSSCELILTEQECFVPGIQGIVKDGIVPGFYGIEAGQSAVGDLFDWFVHHMVPGAYEEEARQRGLSLHQLLSEKMTELPAGTSGLVALDWFNGARSPLMDFSRTGVIAGLTLSTTPEQIYKALVEATAFGTRWIVETLEKSGVSVTSIMLSGGIPQKNPMISGIYASILNRPLTLCQNKEASARGAALLALSASGSVCGCDLPERAHEGAETVFDPDPRERSAYDELYQRYRRLAEYFQSEK